MKVDSGLERYDIVSDTTIKLVIIDHRVPRKHELYLDKNLRVQRLIEERISPRARRYLILKEEVKQSHG